MLPQGEHRGPYLFAAMALVPRMLLQVLIGNGAPICHPRALCTLSESFPAFLISPCNPSLFFCSTDNPTQSESIHHYYILLHIIKIIIIFKSFTCTGGPDPIDPGRFKLASRNLVGLLIIMPLMDTNRLLQVQVDSEVNTELSQVLVED